MNERVDVPDSRHHPDLLAWLSQRSAAFDEWAQATGAPERWDFSPASLEPLEELLRKTFPGTPDIEQQRRGEFFQGAFWYIGEVACRVTGVVWKFEPSDPNGGPVPSLFAEPHQWGTIDTPGVGPAIGGSTDIVRPMAVIRQLYSTVDEFDNPIDVHLSAVMHDCRRYQRLAEWLQAQADGFPQWSGETGTQATWDFSVGSIDDLETLVRNRYRTEAELEADRNGHFMQGAVWYLGELLRREVPDTQWGFDPFTHGTGYDMFVPGSEDELDTPYLCQWYFSDEEYLYPYNYFPLLLWKDTRPDADDAHLLDALEELQESVEE